MDPVAMLFTGLGKAFDFTPEQIEFMKDFFKPERLMAILNRLITIEAAVGTHSTQLKGLEDSVDDLDEMLDKRLAQIEEALGIDTPKREG